MNKYITLSDLATANDIIGVDSSTDFEVTKPVPRGYVYAGMRLAPDGETIRVKHKYVHDWNYGAARNKLWALLESIDVPECILMRVLRMNRSEAFKVRSILNHRLMMQWDEEIPEDFYNSDGEVEFSVGVYGYDVHVIASFREHGGCEATLTYRE